jgi:putative ABC transport system permease protein
VVERELQTAYPEYDVRTNQEQLQATIERQAVVIAGGVSLVALALIAGAALTLNVLLAMIRQQWTEFAALRAIGCSTWTLAGAVAVQALLVGLLGSGLGLVLTVPLAEVLDFVAQTITGFEDVVRTPTMVLVGGTVAGGVTSLVAIAVSGRQLRSIEPTEALAGE